MLWDSEHGRESSGIRNYEWLGCRGPAVIYQKSVGIEEGDIRKVQQGSANRDWSTVSPYIWALRPSKYIDEFSGGPTERYTADILISGLLMWNHTRAWDLK
jgi:hypothetical protein